MNTVLQRSYIYQSRVHLPQEDLDQIINLLKYNRLKKKRILYYSILAANVNHIVFTHCD